MKKRTYNDRAIESYTHDVHRRNAEADIECPIEKGEHTVVHTVALPKEIPKGKL